MDEKIKAYFLGELSEQERIELLREAQTDTILHKEMVSWQNALALSLLAPEATNIAHGQSAYIRLMKKRRTVKTKRTLLLLTQYAAVALLLIVATWMVSDSLKKPAEPMAAVQQELYVPAGQRARITLPDGSIVWLNAGSTLTYPSYFGSERRVRLVGEGFFDVAKFPDKPFIVSTKQVDIKALGTQFNVYCYPGASYMSAMLIEGSVKIYESDNEKTGTLLKPNEQFFYENGVSRVESFSNTDKLLWRDGIYSFEKESFASIIKKLELYYDVEIIVKDPSILGFKYTGKFRQRDGVFEILRIIQQIHHFRIRKNENLNQIILTK